MPGMDLSSSDYYDRVKALNQCLFLRQNLVQERIARGSRNRAMTEVQSLTVDWWRSHTETKAEGLKDYMREIFLEMKVCTKAGNAGIDSKHCGDVIMDGPPSNIYDFVQMLGRTGRLGSVDFGERGPECHVLLSVSLLEKVLKQIEREEDREQRRTARRRFFELMEILLFSTVCINDQFQRRFRSPDNAQQAPYAGIMSPVPSRPDEDHTSRPRPVTPDHDFQDRATNCDKCWVCLLKENAETIWPRAHNTRSSGTQDAELLLLQLIVSKVLRYRCRLDAESRVN